MKSFKPANSKFLKKVFTQLFIVLCIISFPTIYNFITPFKFNVKDSFYWTSGIILFIGLIHEICKKRLYEISFDTDKRIVIFSFKRLFTNLKQEALSFDTINLVILEDSSILRLLSKRLIFWVLKNNRIFYEFKNSSDNFSPKILIEITKTFEELSLPVSRNGVENF